MGLLGSCFQAKMFLALGQQKGECHTERIAPNRTNKVDIFRTVKVTVAALNVRSQGKVFLSLPMRSLILAAGVCTERSTNGFASKAGGNACRWTSSPSKRQ